MSGHSAHVFTDSLIMPLHEFIGIGWHFSNPSLSLFANLPFQVSKFQDLSWSDGYIRKGD